MFNALMLCLYYCSTTNNVKLNRLDDITPGKGYLCCLLCYDVIMGILIYFGKWLGLKQSCLLLKENNWSFYAIYICFCIGLLTCEGVFIVHLRWFISAWWT